MISALVDHLAMFYQKGNLTQVEIIARSMLAAIPDDFVALGFLGLALYQMGRTDDAHRAFKRVVFGVDQQVAGGDSTICEPARMATFRAATRAHCGLGDGWFRIAMIFDQLGLRKPALCAFQAASAASGLSKMTAKEEQDSA